MMISKKSSILLTILVFYSILGVCDNSNYHFSAGGGYDAGGDNLEGVISSSSGFFLDFGAVYKLSDKNNIRLSYGVKKNGSSSNPTNFDVSKDIISTNSENKFNLRSNYLRILGYHKIDNFTMGLGVSYHHRAFFEYNKPGFYNFDLKFKSGFGYHFEIAKEINDSFNLMMLAIGASYSIRNYETNNGFVYNANGFGLFIRFTTI